MFFKHFSKLVKDNKKISIILLLALLGICLYLIIIIAKLPNVDHLRDMNPQKSALMIQRIEQAKRKNKTLTIQQKWISFDNIPQLLKDTVRISEDAGFYHHHGFDLHEFKDSVIRNLQKLRFARGGSTITQQLAKNLFLSTDKTLMRKFKELFLSQKLERKLSKNRIFEIYLNIIEFGDGIFGIEAAANHYYGKSASHLNRDEIIKLVSIIPRPLKVSPLKKSKYLTWRTTLLLKRLLFYKLITQNEYQISMNNISRNITTAEPIKPSEEEYVDYEETKEELDVIEEMEEIEVSE